MSIYAQNYTIDEVTGEVKLLKHLNKIRVDRISICRSGKWNKNGSKARYRKKFYQGEKKLEYQIIQKELNKEKVKKYYEIIILHIRNRINRDRISDWVYIASKVVIALKTII